MGLSDAGYTPPRLADLLADLDAAIEREMGITPDSDRTPVLRQLQGVFAAQLASAHELLAEVVNVLDPRQASGALLDGQAALTGGVERREPTASVGLLRIAGTPGTVVPVGYRVATSDRAVTVETTVQVTIPDLGLVDVPARALEQGPMLAGADTLTTKVGAVPGVSSVTNPDALTPGRARESDHELRVRRSIAHRRIDAGTDMAMLAALLELPELQQALVLSNRTGGAAADGTPAHAGRLVLYPSTLDTTVLDAIATVIWRTQPIGIEIWGQSRTAIVTDVQGVAQTVRWDWADEVEVWVGLSLSLRAGAPVDTREQARHAVVDYINSLRMGQTVRALALCAAVYGVGYIDAATIYLGRSAKPVGVVDLAMARDEIPRTDAAKVELS